MSAIRASSTPQPGIAQAWSPGLTETSFDGCRIDELALSGGIVSLVVAGGIVRIWDAELGEFQLYSNTLAEVQLDYPGKGAVELMERWRVQATLVSVDVRLWDDQVVVHAGCDAVAGTIPAHVHAAACPFD